MLGALGAFLRKDERTLFKDQNTGRRGELLVQSPFDEKSNGFLEELAENVCEHVLSVWEEKFELDSQIDEIRQDFERCRIRILYVGSESLEWVCYTDYDEPQLQILAGVYQRFNFEFGDGKFHDIVSMGTTEQIKWDLTRAREFDPDVINLVGQVVCMQSEFESIDCMLPDELWHLIMSYTVDCFKPVTDMEEVDIVLKEIRRWCQNLYLSQPLLKLHKEERDDRIRHWGAVFIQIGVFIDSEYRSYLQKQNSLTNKISEKIQTFRESGLFSIFRRSKSVRDASDETTDDGEDDPPIIRRAQSVQTSPSPSRGSRRQMSLIRMLRGGPRGFGRQQSLPFADG